MIIPKYIQEIINKQELHTLSTSTKEGIPNIIYLKYLKVYNNEQILIANNKFFKTEKNLLENPKISFIVLDKENGKAYQIKGNVEIHKNDKATCNKAEGKEGCYKGSRLSYCYGNVI